MGAARRRGDADRTAHDRRVGGVYVGLDLGTSSLKGVAVTAAGEIVAESRAAYPTVREAPGQAE